jgi:hypothetical protein
MDDITTDPVLADIVTEGLNHWFHQTPQPPRPLTPTYADLITSQTNIGWNQLLLGRWSIHWITLQSAYLQRNSIQFTPQNHSTGWLSSIIKLIWTHCHDEWLTRNAALHGLDKSTRSQASFVRAKFRIRALYDLRQQCSPYAQRHWFYTTPDIHFAKEPDLRRLENWISLNEARILSQVTFRQQNLQFGQHTIDDYFPPIT